MDCTHCEPVLLDLCYGELPPAQEREVRAHIHECPTCRKALSRLEAGQALARHLPDEAPSPELTDRILRAAQAHLRQRGTPLERFQGFLESIARIAMTRQVAMATMSLLIVFVGLWSVPELTRRRDARGAVVVESPHEGEAGPSREVAANASQPTAAPASAPVEAEPPAEPMLARKRVASGAGAPRKAAAEAVAKRAERIDRAEKSDRSRAGVADKDLLAARSQPKAEARSSHSRFAPPPQPSAAAPAAPAQVAAADAKAKSSQYDDLLAAPIGSATGETRQSDRRVARFEEDEPLEGLASESAPAPPTPARAPTTLEDVFAAGVERYRAEDYAAAAQLFARMLESSAPSAQRAAALLYLARSERALGRCERAIRAYETLVRSYGSAQQSAVALSEGVACFDQIGDAAGAQRLLEHATSVPSLSAQAQKTLHDRAAPKTVEPPAANAVQPRP